jgi:epoxyqueuosine reductase
VLIAIGNSNDKGFRVEAERLVDDDSALVRGAAAWALSQLTEPEEFAARAAKALGVELDETVRAEWQVADNVGNHTS